MARVEDCRDYLRTGRCKYGASCKYSHPSNVQSGGGMKAPINPGEPMFPLRPAEPICQYYMKHGTCKFGQACKFHHPPPSLHHHLLHSGQSLHALMGGGTAATSNGASSRAAGGFAGPATMLMSLGGQHHAVVTASADHHQSGGGAGAGAPHSLLCNPIGTDPASGSMILQFLPQRPDEPDCIYFLKNGRCKYGATCRYHHPIAPYQPNSAGRHQHRLVVDDPPRRLPPMHSQTVVRMVSGGGGMNSSRGGGGSPPDSSPSSSYRVHSGTYASQMIPAYGTQRSSSSSSLAGGGGANDVQYLNIDTLSSSPLQPVPVVSMDGTTSYAYPIASSTAAAAGAHATSHPHHGNEHNSSASSLASSYETAAGSSLDHQALWNRARRNGSGGSLNAYHHSHETAGGGGGAGSRLVSSAASGGRAMPHSASDGNIVGRRNRSTSYGSTSDTSYYDSASTPTLSRTASVGSWRNSNSDPSVASMSQRGGAVGGGTGGGGRNMLPFHYATAVHDAGDYSNGSPSTQRLQQQQHRFAVMMPPGAAAGMRLRRSPRGGGPGGIRRGENDEGFTMMTSALLNMLDAPEEMVGYDHDGEEEDGGGDDDDYFEDPHMYYEAAAYSHQSAHLSQQDPHGQPCDSFDPEFFERLSLSRNTSYGVPEQQNGHQDNSSWSPGYRNAGGGASSGISHEPPHVVRRGNDDPMQRVLHQHAAAVTTTAPAHGAVGGNGGGGDYGLFLS
jgi:Zinc finger C-x8-C-x5-C-x3-H type (and similar)